MSDLSAAEIAIDVELEKMEFSGLDNSETELICLEKGFENTLEIFINLSVDRVHYKKSSKNLYFVDSQEALISRIITKVLKGFNQIPDIQQCYLDQHRFFKGAFCIKLGQIQSGPVLVALRLQGIHIEIT